MSDVRVELTDLIYDRYPGLLSKGPMYPPYADDIADAILERWDLTSKAVVTAEELGKMVKIIGPVQIDIYSAAVVGKRMLDQLDAAGLVIVRREEVER
jgi:hypothetical protein